MKFSPLALAACLLGACAPMQPTPPPPAVNLPHNQEMFGLVQSLESNAANVRKDACTANDHACVLSVLAMQRAAARQATLAASSARAGDTRS